MRTLIIILAGFAVWLACLGIAKMLGGTPAAYAKATRTFVALWLLAAAGNMWVGVAQAGYSVQEELPIFLLIFLLPASAAVFTKWKFL
jgi:hypothetical protein